MHISYQGSHVHNADGSVTWTGGLGGGGTSGSTAPATSSTSGLTAADLIALAKSGSGDTPLTFEQQLQLRSAPTYSSSNNASTSSSTSQSLQDPAALALQQRQLDQQAQQFAAEQQLASSKMWQDMQLAWAKLNFDINSTNQRLSFEQQNMAFLQDKLRIESAAANQTAIRETQALIEQIGARMERTATERASLTQQAQALQSQMQYQAQVENARNQIETDKTNEARRQANLQQRTDVARSMAEFAKDPGDVGANAAFLTAGGAAPISQAMAAGKDARTAQSLLPLGLLQGTMDELGRGPNYLTAPTVTAPSVTLPQFATTTPPTASMLGLSSSILPTQLSGSFLQASNLPRPPLSEQQQAPPAAPGAAAAPTSSPTTTAGQQEYLDWIDQQQASGEEQSAPGSSFPYGTPDLGRYEGTGWNFTAEELAAADPSDGVGGTFDWADAVAQQTALGHITPGYAQGTRGVANDPMAIVGEAGGTPELLLNHAEIPGGPKTGFSIVPNHALPPQMGGQQMPMQANPMASAMMPPGFLQALPQQAAPQAMQNRGRGIPAFAEGTPDWQALMGGANPAASFDRSLGFLNSAFQQALGQSPWAQSGVPTPVGLSSPGTNPFLQEYAAALAATGSGIKPGLFQYEINQWKPQALSGQTVTRRTR